MNTINHILNNSVTNAGESTIISLFGVPNAHTLNVTSELCYGDKQTGMVLSKYCLWIHLCNFKLFNNVLSF